jgi:hypothetical protein
MNSEGSELRVNLDPYTLKKVMKDYKKIKKYMRSPIYQIKKMDGSETTITKLMQELEDT